MGGKGRRGRPWAGLRGPTEEANRLAELLRAWLDDAGLRLDDLLRELKPEHFENQTVPGRTTVADRLAGMNLRWDFVEAVADACSGDAAEYERLRQQARPLYEAAVSAPPGARPGPRDSGTGRQVRSPFRTGPALLVPVRDLVVVQRRSLELSDQLMRALQRTAELEKARNDAHHMVLILLTLVDKLHRDIATLTAERERAAAPSRAYEALDEVHEQLRHSEAQRAQAETELSRARAEREKADRLAEQSAEQVHRLTAELSRLRQQHGPVGRDTDAAPEHEAPTPVLPEQRTSDDIDIALMKATRIIDTGAERLNRLAEELREEQEETPDSAVDEPPVQALDKPAGQAGLPRATGEEAPNNEPDKDADNAALELLFGAILPLRRGDPLDEVFPFLVIAAQNWTTELALVAIRRLRSAGEAAAADAFLLAIGTARPAPYLGALLDGGLTPTDADLVVRGMATNRPARHFQQAVGHFRRSGLARLAHEVLLAAGQLRPVRELPLLLSSLEADRTADRVLVLNGVRREGAGKVAEALGRLLEVGMAQEADILRIAAIGSPGPEPVALEPGSPPWGHASWFRPGRFVRRDPVAEPLPSQDWLAPRIRITIPGSLPVPPVVPPGPVTGPQGESPAG
ncbi:MULTISPECIES: hypothetical protein [Streptomyces]|uniref:hypothetical protein n=1 Tax=Streptomyces TaxID=1883 RepID=UPI001677B42D|nr:MULTISPECIES: hypothetical protein [Streptomyces]MBK3522012.1 hypothetical protein [Streptomyces sp. MBT70]GGS04507.1 hypothetical protein GCM10010236_68880 [Streptomyces eurythermus]